jgi:hypothetical protein
MYSFFRLAIVLEHGQTESDSVRPDRTIVRIADNVLQIKHSARLAIDMAII